MNEINILEPTIQMRNINVSMLCQTKDRLTLFPQVWNSVFKPILDEKKNVELIIIDNGSHNLKKLTQIKNLIKNYNTITLIHHSKNRGVSMGLNSGIRLSRGNYIFSCSDDILMPDNNWFDESLNLLSLKGIGLVVWSFQVGGHRYEPSGELIEIDGRVVEIPIRTTIGPWMISRRMLDKFGYNDEGFGPWGYIDLDRWERFKKIEDEIIVFGPGFPRQITEKNKKNVSAIPKKLRDISREKNRERFLKKLDKSINAPKYWSPKNWK